VSAGGLHGCDSAILAKTPTTTGVDSGVFDGIKTTIAADDGFPLELSLQFLQRRRLEGQEDQRRNSQLSWNIAAGASPKGTLDCVRLG
jgi:non-heme chloroperoxidase